MFCVGSNQQKYICMLLKSFKLPKTMLHTLNFKSELYSSIFEG